MPKPKPTMTTTHAKRIAFHLEGLLAAVNPKDLVEVAHALENAVADAYHKADATHAQRVAFAGIVARMACAAAQQVEAETGGLLDDALDAGKPLARIEYLTDVRESAERLDIAVGESIENYESNL